VGVVGAALGGLEEERRGGGGLWVFLHKTVERERERDGEKKEREREGKRKQKACVKKICRPKLRAGGTLVARPPAVAVAATAAAAAGTELMGLSLSRAR
jgi:hypothetical protein